MSVQQCWSAEMECAFFFFFNMNAIHSILVNFFENTAQRPECVVADMRKNEIGPD